MGFLKNHFEKILFVLLLAAVGITLLVLTNLRAGRETPDSVRLPPAGAGAPADLSAMDALIARLSDDSVQVEVAVNTFTPPERVMCMNPDDRSLIPTGVEICPFCGWEQREQERDSDGDGIPDHLELRWGLNPQDPADVHQSLDNSGFSVLFQHERGHDPTDPSDYPPHLEFLRVKEIQSETIDFQFRGFTQLAENVYRVQLRIRYPGQEEWQTLHVRAGDDPTGEERNRFGRSREFTASRFREAGELVDGRFQDQSYVTILGGRTPMLLYREGPRSTQSIVNRTATLHLFMGPEWSKQVRPDETFILDNKSYKVVDIHEETVVLQAADSETRHIIGRATQAEIEKASPNVPEPSGGQDGDSTPDFELDPSLFF